MAQLSESLGRRPRVAVLGAGFTGLTTAFRLAQNNVEVHVFEKQDCIGGLASGFRLQDGTALERAYHAHCAAGQPLRAARCAFWLGFRVLMRGEMGRASGWFARARLKSNIQTN